MKKFKPTRIVVSIGFFIVVIFLFITLFLNQIKTGIFYFTSTYRYLAIFLITLLVEALAQPIGPEIPLLSGKIIGLNIFYVFLITTIASTFASLLNYMIGKLFYKKICSYKNCKKYLTWYQRYGKYSLLVSSLGPVPYVPFCWFSGAFGLSIKKFFYFGIFPRTLRIMFVSYIIFLVL